MEPRLKGKSQISSCLMERPLLVSMAINHFSEAPHLLTKNLEYNTLTKKKEPALILQEAPLSCLLRES